MELEYIKVIWIGILFCALGGVIVLLGMLTRNYLAYRNWPSTPYECNECMADLTEEDIDGICCPECRMGQPNESRKWWSKKIG